MTGTQSALVYVCACVCVYVSLQGIWLVRLASALRSSGSPHSPAPGSCGTCCQHLEWQRKRVHRGERGRQEKPSALFHHGASSYLLEVLPCAAVCVCVCVYVYVYILEP